jgi:hypothetical protein
MWTLVDSIIGVKTILLSSYGQEFYSKIMGRKIDYMFFQNLSVSNDSELLLS